MTSSIPAPPEDQAPMEDLRKQVAPTSPPVAATLMNEADTDTADEPSEPKVASEQEPSEPKEASDPKDGEESDPTKTMFPQARVRSVMKIDRDVQMVGTEAVLAVSVAAQKFLEHFAVQSYAYTREAGRKTVSHADLAKAVAENVELMFLEDIIPPVAAPESKKSNSKKGKSRAVG
ncbi:uncharacterized protein EV422DRAFT_504703 [Fimicolochytrium jonesii]|uniref:uncharacterized protein n=1 Tax=Fimicolochytrium jonesii TaxID=1396493 RepID=UPI0022FEC363|nr:uncharacterized protein EV422DRAFT_504703 [Fimicolochytrium jonesii]KAI8823511.1 hypothetical protein EV422DRAFT_504703 [Fimicolochytrium jonesii]